MGRSGLSRVLWSGASLLAMMVIPSQACAQAAAEGGEAAVDEVVVTGSRIQNPGMTSPTPLTVLGAEQFKRTTPSSVDDIITQLPAFRSNSGVNQVQRNAGSISTGQSLANLRGLGAQRTLTLIDGQRPAPTNAQGTTSTSIIPVGLIKRVEVVTGGASAAYGSDAVAGVVNFVLKDRIDHLEGQVIAGRSQRGDNEEWGVSLADGFSLMDDRLHVVVGADYNDNKGVGNIYKRGWASVEAGNSGTPLAFGATRPAGTPAFGWATGVEYATQTPGGVINTARTPTGATVSLLNQLAFAPNGGLYRLERGPVFGNLMINSSSNHVATPIAQWNLKQPLEALSTMGKAVYDVSEDTSIFVQAGYAWSNVFTLSQYHQTPTVTILATNPYLPAATRALMQANNIASFDMGRVDTEWLGTSADNTYKTFEVSTGIKGKVLDRFSWDLSYNYGRSVIDSKVYGTREANLAAAEYAVLDASGNIVCGPVATNPNFAAARLTNTIQPGLVQPGCVPLNPFGIGNSSQAARDYVAGLEFTRDVMVRHDVALNVSGSLFELPAGPIAFATGLEYRRDTLDQTADPLQILGLYSSGNNKSYSGKETVREGYAEVEVPLLKDVPFFNALGVNGAVRRTDYKISGAVTTWKVGGTWEPLDGLLLRMTRSRDIRAPSLSELFLVGGISATGSFVNPFNGQSARLPVQTLGNSNLVPERADTFSVGGTWRAPAGPLSGLRVSVDYFRIKVRDVIASVGATDILQRCFQNVTIYCSAITFDNSAFGISKVLTQPFNQSVLLAEGQDFEVGYRTDLDGVGLPGSIDINAFATHLSHLKTTDRTGPLGITVDNAGVQAGQSKWVGSAFINYRFDPITVGLQMRAFSKIRYSALFFGPEEDGYNPTLSTSINKNVFPSLVYFNLNGSYDFERFGRKFQAFANVNNLFDKDPPALAIAAINLGGNPYDYVGRTFKVGLRFGF
ncbi:MAG: TonB-dependent receptor [Phenylobacterium sp.]|uniref:TonB-dependent receptor domain-containing protein n=1 Tax=Phenylobacterium sp. TaxID=1871053 RepID=UPI001A60B0C3|nr:TonB-dependent receptor [Phenylobacterium sp.]MBL8553977.1 TonB-dependent receptor [Phenylobacterium sp.]